MRVLMLPVKNITKNWVRTLSLGFFMFVSCIIYFICGSVIGTIKTVSNDALINGLTGDVQIRNCDVEQRDFVDVNTSWQNAEYLKADELKKAWDYLNAEMTAAEVYERVRHVGMLTLGDSYSDAMLMGISEKDNDYLKSFIISEGGSLKDGAKQQIVISKEIAEKLQAKLGDTIAVNSVDINDNRINIELKIVGIGRFESLADYGNNICFADIDSVRMLKGLAEDEATELILRGIKAERAPQIARTIEKAINTEKTYIITSWKSQGGYIRVIHIIITAVFYSFIAIMVFIICLSIGNMVGAIAIERVREIGTMRAIGLSRGLVSFLFVAEIFLIALAASFLGTVTAGVICVLASGRVFEIGSPLNVIIGSHFKLQYSILQAMPGIVVFIALGCLAAYSPVRKMNKNQLVDLINNDF